MGVGEQGAGFLRTPGERQGGEALGIGPAVEIRAIGVGELGERRKAMRPSGSERSEIPFSVVMKQVPEGF